MADLVTLPDPVNPIEQLPSDKVTKGSSPFVDEKMEAQRQVMT